MMEYRDLKSRAQMAIKRHFSASKDGNNHLGADHSSET
jgi:hypothetical protein